MRKRKWSTQPPIGDAASSFLLPYDETPEVVLHTSLDKPATKDEPQRFAACVLHRTTSAALANGTCVHAPPHRFTIHSNEFALLRPPDNSMRPAIARIHYFLKLPNGKLQVRVQWFYRPEDLSERPPRAVGEDELFETQHFDNVHIIALTGRCAVSAYDEWSRAAALRAPERPPRPSPVASPSPPPRTNGNVSDSQSDASSFFWDNYSEAAVDYYCRYMYDPYAHLFVLSQFEVPDADPEADLAELREQTAHDAHDHDYAAPGKEPDDDDGDVDADVDELISEVDMLRNAPRSGGRKRARGAAARPRGFGSVVASGAREKATQFCLPSDIGAGGELPCRDTEKAHVRSFLVGAIEASAAGRDGGARCLYVSGVPGTGKTATIREELRSLAALRSRGELPNFASLEINGMSVPDPAMVYSELLAAMTGNTRVAPAQAAALLERRFARGDGGNVRGDAARERRMCVVLLLDEMDVLVSRAQKVLYDLLDWPTRPRSGLVVIGVANTMDLPERMLPRLASRLGLNRLAYAPYNKTQLTTILDMRLPALHTEEIFDTSTVRLCAAKVGAVSGDVRRALQLCRRAAEIAREETKAGEKIVVKPCHLNAAVQHASGTARLGALEELSLFETLALVAAIVLVRAHGSFAMDETASVQAVCEKAREIAIANRNMFKFGVPHPEELEECVLRLANLRVLLLERNSMLRNSRVIINLLVDDCCFALRDDNLAKKVLTV